MVGSVRTPPARRRTPHGLHDRRHRLTGAPLSRSSCWSGRARRSCTARRSRPTRSSPRPSWPRRPGPSWPSRPTTPCSPPASACGRGSRRRSRWTWPRRCWMRCGRSKVIVRGPKAHGAAVTNGLDVHWQTPNGWASEMVDHLAGIGVAGARVAVQLDGASGAPLAKAVGEIGAVPVAVPVYEWTMPSDTTAAERLVEAMVDGRVDGVTFTARPRWRTWPPSPSAWACSTGCWAPSPDGSSRSASGRCARRGSPTSACPSPCSPTATGSAPWSWPSPTRSGPAHGA